MHKERKMFLIATWFYLRKKNVFVKERVHYYLKIIRIRSYFDFDSLIKSREMIYSPALNMQHGLSTFHRMNRVLEQKQPKTISIPRGLIPQNSNGFVDITYRLLSKESLQINMELTHRGKFNCLYYEEFNRIYTRTLLTI